MIFKYGLIYKGVRYGWSKKKLFRLPFERNNRTYGLKEIHPIQNGKVYYLQKIKKTIKQIELLTTEVNWSIDVIRHPDCPF